ncbi:MAG: RICIN domain-containing protein [Segetibacter sp.]
MRIFSLSIIVAILFCSFTSIAQKIKGTYAIKNVSTGMLLRVMDANKKNETPIVAYSPTNWKCMTWDFNQVEGNTYLLRNLFTNKTFQPQKGEMSEGIALEQQAIDNSKTTQQWEFISAANNTYMIKLKGSDLYVTPSDKNGAVNSKIILSKKRSDKTQYWNIYEQHPDI